MRIILSHQRRGDMLIVEKTGDVLTLNGEKFDFGNLNDGDRIRAADIPSEFIVGDVSKNAGEIEIGLLLPHGGEAEEWQLHPEPIENVPDGVVDLPTDTWTEQSEVEVEGGVNLVQTTHRWHQPDEVETIGFIPNVPAPETEETE